MGTALVLGTVAAASVVGPTLAKTPKQWVPVSALENIRPNDVTTIPMKYESKSGLYTQQVDAPVLVSHMGNEIVCFKANCPHSGLRREVGCSLRPVSLFLPWRQLRS